VLYTDGATDVRPPHDLDPARLLALVDQAAHSSSTAEGVADRLHDALEAVLPFDQRNDDIALLVLRVTGTEARREV
jgi:serine phosphatase RsbU (regulator of sigma subunit)